MQVKILKKRKSVWTDSNGDEVINYWYTAERQDNEVTIDFVSMYDGYEVGEGHDLNILKKENSKGGFYFKEQF